MFGEIRINAYVQTYSALHQAERLKTELEKLGVDVRVRRNAPVPVSADGKIDYDEKTDFILYLDKDKAISRALEKAGVRLFNSAQSVELCDDKMLTYLALSGQGIRMPRTVMAPLCYTAEAEPSAEFVKTVEALGYPLVAKECYGSLGKGVYLVHDRAQLLQTEKNLRFCAHLYQEYIAESSGRDMRIIVIGGKTVGAMIRRSDSDFRSNIGAGGKGTAVVAPLAFADMAERAAKILGLDYCGVDVLFAKDGPVLCEVNSNAFFESMERVSGVNVAELYAKHIVKTLRRDAEEKHEN